MKNLKISNFKCFDSIEISELERVNLFTGKNNTGKSSILEAILILFTKGDFSRIYRLLNNRGENLIELRDIRNSEEVLEKNFNILSSLFKNREIGFSKTNNITISSNKDSISIRFVKFVDEETEKNELGSRKVRKYIDDTLDSVEVPENEIQYGLNILTDKTNYLFELAASMHIRRININYFPHIHFIDSAGNDINDNAGLWDKITLTEKEEMVIDALKIIEPNINRLSFVGEDKGINSRYPIVKLSHTKSLYPLKSMGDGINRILTIILALVNSEKGILLIDEFENGLHYSVQKELWEIIFMLSTKLDIQVIATTHSNDSIYSFAKVLEGNEKYDGSLYRLDRNDDDITAYNFSKDEITEAAKQNINLR